VKCPECERLRRAYVEATKRSTELSNQIANNRKITGKSGAFSKESKAMDKDWNAAGKRYWRISQLIQRQDNLCAPSPVQNASSCPDR